MIFCELSALDSYKGLNANLDTAIDFLQKHRLQELQLGSTKILGSEVYVNRFDYTTKEPDQLLFETHRIFADIHLLLEGAERIFIAPVETLEEVEEDMDTDYIGSKGTETSLVHMRSHTALIVFPGEAHKVMCVDEEFTLVKKAVVKVRIKN